MALLLGELEPLNFIDPHQVSSLAFVEDKEAAWCIQSNVERSLHQRLVHGLLLTASALIGQVVRTSGALLINNIGPAYWRDPCDAVVLATPCICTSQAPSWFRALCKLQL
jgi:hypothetical protein